MVWTCWLWRSARQAEGSDPLLSSVNVSCCWEGVKSNVSGVEEALRTWQPSWLAAAHHVSFILTATAKHVLASGVICFGVHARRVPPP